MTAAPGERLLAWIERGEGVEVDAVLGSDGLLVTVERDGERLSAVLPARGVEALADGLEGWRGDETLAEAYAEAEYQCERADAAEERLADAERRCARLERRVTDRESATSS